jgi:nitrite reductase/ring-hydroxylating ferredoxin subunit
MNTRYVVGAVADLPPGSSTIVYPDKVKSGIGVFNVDGQFYALKNTCPHMGGPLCRGRVRGTTEPDTTNQDRVGMHWVRDGEIIACPWHHWEFDIKTGRTIFASKQRVRSYPVAVEPPEVMERLKKGVETVPVSVEDATIVLLL